MKLFCKSSFCKSSFSAALAACLLAACSKEIAKPQPVADNAIPVTVAKVELLAMDRTLPIVGTLFGKDEATIGAEVEGKVEKTMAEFGDRVQAGQEIAAIDTTTYEALSRQSTAKVAKAKATALNAEQTLARTQALQKEKISSPSDLDKAVADAELARADLQSAEADEAIAQLNLKRSHVAVPFDSAVGDRLVTMGDYVKSGTPMFRVVNDSVLKYIVQAPEGYAHDIKKEQPVILTVDDWPTNIFEGRVYLIGAQVNTTTRTFPLGALVQNRDHKLRANSFARGELILERNVSTPTIPLDAVINFAGVTRVFVVENGIAHSREVKVGRIKNGRQEILTGLKPGETVVVTGQAKLQDDSKVRLKISETDSQPATDPKARS